MEQDLKKIRNAVGVLTHANHRLGQDKRELHADILRLRDDVTRAIKCLQGGEVAEAETILQSILTYREQTRIPRKTQPHTKT